MVPSLISQFYNITLIWVLVRDRLGSSNIGVRLIN